LSITLTLQQHFKNHLEDVYTQTQTLRVHHQMDAHYNQPPARETQESHVCLNNRPRPLQPLGTASSPVTVKVAPFLSTLSLHSQPFCNTPLPPSQTRFHAPVQVHPSCVNFCKSSVSTEPLSSPRMPILYVPDNCQCHKTDKGGGCLSVRPHRRSPGRNPKE
jgi:hypothetical protein